MRGTGTVLGRLRRLVAGGPPRRRLIWCVAGIGAFTLAHAAFVSSPAWTQQEPAINPPAGYQRGASKGSWVLWRHPTTRACEFHLTPKAHSETPTRAIIKIIPERTEKEERIAVEAAFSTKVSDISVLQSNVRTSVTAKTAPPSRVFWSAAMPKLVGGTAEFYMTWTEPTDDYLGSARFEPAGLREMLRDAAQQCDMLIDDIIESPTPGEQQEARISLTSQAKRHIVFILHDRYDKARTTPPKIAWPPPPETRELLVRYARDKRLYMSRYLTREAYDQIMKEKYDQAPLSVAKEQGYKRHTDWETWVSSSDPQFCYMRSAPQKSVGPTVWRLPTIVLRARGGSGSSVDINVNLQDPNLLSTVLPAMAEVEKSWLPLAVRGPTVLPSSGTESRFMKSISGVKNFTILGREAETGLPVEFVYSGGGFRAALSQVSKDCKRPGIMSWID